MNAVAITQKSAHIHTKQHSKIFSSRRMVKESSLSKPISLAKMYHSSPLSLIHLLIPLFLCHFIQMFPELVFCPWETDVLLGIMAKCHVFLSIYILFWGLHSAVPIFCVWNACERVCSVYVYLCVESWARCLSENAVTTAPNPPCIGIYSPQPPISALVCLSLQRLVHNLPTSPYFTLGEEHRTRVRRLPSSHLWDLALPQEHTHAQTRSQHMHSVSVHCLICIWAQVVH